jgi:hypothetical protein
VGVCDYGPDYAPRLAYTGSESSQNPLNFHFQVPCKDKQVGSCIKTAGQHHGNSKNPCWCETGVSYMYWALLSNKYISLEEEEKEEELM